MQEVHTVGGAHVGQRAAGTATTAPAIFAALFAVLRPQQQRLQADRTVHATFGDY